MDIYHYHLTLTCNAEELAVMARSVKGKPTEIDLERDSKSQIDRMITKYWKGRAEDGLPIALRDITQLGKPIVRLKTERVVNGLPRAFNCPMEVHVKTDGTFTDPIVGFAISSNRADGNRFYNARIYNKWHLEVIRRNLELIKGVKEVQYEEVIFDSNPVVDEWWTPWHTPAS